MGERTRGEGGRGERQKVGRIPSLLSATPWGKKSKRKGGWTLGGWKNHRCDSRQVPIGRPLYIYRYTCIYICLGQASSCLLHPLCRILPPLGKSFPSHVDVISFSPLINELPGLVIGLLRLRYTSLFFLV